MSGSASKAGAVTKTSRANARFPRSSRKLDSGQVGYWHDFGHLQIKENLGFLDHAEWLRTIGPRTLGCHVQDCIWPAQDHQPPFAGDVDLRNWFRSAAQPACLSGK
jgi:hypothetical protein